MAPRPTPPKHAMPGTSNPYYTHERPDDRGLHGANPPHNPVVILPQFHALPEVPTNVYPHVPAQPLPVQKAAKAPRKPLK